MKTLAEARLEHKTIHDKLTIIQNKLNVPKKRWNKFEEYHYRKCEDILEAVKPLLLAEGCFLGLTDKMEHIAGRFYVVATASFFYNGDVIESTGYAREQENKKGMDEAQITGAGSSYARKYALDGLFLLGDSPDPDEPNSNQPGPAPAASRVATPPASPLNQRIELCLKMFRNIGSSEAELENYLDKPCANWDDNDLAKLSKLFDDMAPKQNNGGK